MTISVMRNAPDLTALIWVLKDIPLECRTERTEDGEVMCWLEVCPGLWGKGRNKSDAVDDMYQTLKDGAEDYFSDAYSCLSKAPENLTVMLKVMFSMEEDFKACLSGLN